jgi:uridine kinase
MHAQDVTIKPDEILIIEGTIALLCSPDIPGRRIYVDTAVSDRRDRFLALQQLRGKAPDDADKLFVERENEEMIVVEDSRKCADAIVTFLSPFKIEIKNP